MKAVASLEVHVAAGWDGANNTEAWACKTLGNMSELRALFESPSQRVSGERARVAEVLDTELVRALTIIFTFLSGSEGMVMEVISDGPDGFRAKLFSYVPSSSAGGPSDQAQV